MKKILLMTYSLQALIGTDAKNPFFTVFRNSKSKKIEVYHGICLLETIVDEKDNPQLKLLIARLKNAGVKTSILTRQFGYCYRSIIRWSKALENGDLEQLVEVLKGQGAPKKLNKEVEGFAGYEFKRIYPNNKYSYSKEIRKSIEEVFGYTISSETLRPLFYKLKEKMKTQNEAILKKS